MTKESPTPPISVLVLTLNEEANLPRCLESLRWCDDIVVLDSGSSDRTVEIAREYGARVVTRPFDNWASHQNWALESIEYRHPWLYYSDADEVMPPELRDELSQVATPSSQPHAAYRVRYKNYFLGRWIRHCGIYPTWVLRFYKPEKVRYERLVNPTAKVDGSIGLLQEHFLHYSFNKGLQAWFDKHNKYSTAEAIETIRDLREGAIDWAGLVDFANPARRRLALKHLSFRLPFRPLLRFLYMYVLKLGFLDGAAGFHYCMMLSIYEYMIVLKVRELRRRERGESI
jgi:glycosyltransferase involved in cell wall biosynthesis